MQDNASGNRVNSQRLLALTLSLGMLVLGVLYYGFLREHVLSAGIVQSHPQTATHTLLLSLRDDLAWLPSFTHAFASVLCLQSVLIGGFSVRWRARFVLVVLLFFIEAVFGTVDGKDVLAIVAGVLLAETVAWRLGLFLVTSSSGAAQSATFTNRQKNRLASSVVVTASVLMAAGSYVDGFYSECANYDVNGSCLEYKRAAIPVYMSYQVLRESVRIESSRPPDRLGRVYLYQNYVFLNERNEGIHIIDNSEPTAPVNLGFIRIPGNTEIAIRDNYLYADSYVDLITLNLNDPSNIQVVNRQENLFPYDAFQNIPYNVSLSRADLDPQRGVIVSYQLTEN